MAILEIKRLRKHFGGFHALQGIDLSIDPGLIWSIIGPNGAGKSTLFQLISGLLSPTGGEIFFKGTSLSRFKPNQRTALGIAVTFQNLRLFPKMTVLENVLVGQHCRIKANLGEILFGMPFRLSRKEKKARIRAQEVLELAGLLITKDELVSNLSYGQQKLIALARSLATEPELLLLDEPAAGLNPQETSELGRLMKTIVEGGKTICFIEHDMSMVMDISDMVTVLNFGVKIAEGPPQSIKCDSQVIEAYLGVHEE
jgi:branched-chain amino acid transport system ATP-binding protein